MKIALLFPGQGAQKVGMGKELYENFPPARLVYEEASDALGRNIAKLCFEGPESDLALTENTQPAVLVTCIATLRVLESETTPNVTVTAGHSLGEYSAIFAAGGLALSDAARIVRLRGRFMQEAVPEGEGAMSAIIGLGDKEIEELCEEVADITKQTIVPSNYNSPEQTAVSGHTGAVARAGQLAIERGAKRVVPLRVSAPFHSPLMKPASERLEEQLRKVPFRDATLPVLSNVDAEAHKGAAEFSSLLARQVVQPVRWTGCMAKLRELDIDLAIEVGPGKVLTGLLRNCDKDIKTANVEDIQSLKKTVAVIK